MSSSSGDYSRSERGDDDAERRERQRGTVHHGCRTVVDGDVMLAGRYDDTLNETVGPIDGHRTAVDRGVPPREVALAQHEKARNGIGDASREPPDAGAIVAHLERRLRCRRGFSR